MGIESHTCCCGGHKLSNADGPCWRDSRSIEPTLLVDLSNKDVWRNTNLIGIIPGFGHIWGLIVNPGGSVCVEAEPGIQAR